MARIIPGTTSNFIGLTGAITVTFPFSYMAWVNPTTYCGQILGNLNGSGGLEIQCIPINFVNSINMNRQSLLQIATSFLKAQASFWQHIIVAYGNTGASAPWTMYLNGLPAGSGTATTQVGDASTYVIGKTGQNEFTQATMADVAFAKFIVTPAEAFMLGTGRMRPATLRPGSANYVGYWPFNGADGAGTEFDYSGNANHATINGAVPFAPDPPQLNPAINVIKFPVRAASQVSLSPIGFGGFPSRVRQRPVIAA